ncbi:ferritin-like domain-containing protein [Larkinella soli]|uniref:ferritin-like domain-containing protein n=1 Tax=Larkinella soli TaxID=1770527 RepID=UPI000FFB3C7A|nr:ferritin-like domain-containing protein [Larkinella soli]
MKQLSSEPVKKETGPSVPAIPSVERRMFLRTVGLFTASTAAFLASCQNSVNELAPANRSGARTAADAGGKSFGTGDIAILNYAYALEQLETAFYRQAVEKLFSDIRGDEKMVLSDIHDHELVHREFFKAALGPYAIQDLEFKFPIDFNHRQEVLNTARQLEDTGVGAYNGAGPLLTNGTFLTLAGKIVSVEARHAALIRTILRPGTSFFAGDDVVKTMGLDISLKPSQVIPMVAKFITTTGLDFGDLLSR